MRVKLCGLTRREDLERAVELGADAVGVVLEVSSRRCVRLEGELAAGLRAVAGRAERMGVFGDVPVDFESELLDGVQGVGASERGFGVRTELVRTWDEARVRGALAAGAWILVDGHQAGSWGGTGVTADADLVVRVAELAEGRWMLAGGLTPETVAVAVARWRPAGVDVSSGIEEADRVGVKDWGKMAAFVAAARG